MKRFSLRLLRDGSTGEEWVEPADEIERLVFLRSRMFDFYCGVVWCIKENRVPSESSWYW